MSVTEIVLEQYSTQVGLVQPVTVVSMASVVVGPQGPPGAAGGALAEYEAAAALSGHQAIALDAQGKAVYASCNDLTQLGKVVGISTGAAALGADISVQAKDVLEHGGWNWSNNATILLGAGGALVETLPGSAVFSQVLGRALAPTRILVGVDSPIVL